VERLMDGKKADMVFTDPPYGVEYEGRKKFDVLLGDSKDESLDFLSDASTNILAYMKTGGAFYMCVGWPTISTFLNTLEKYEELNLSTKIVWVKNTIGWGFADYRTSSEVILYGFKNGAKHFWAGGRGERDVWNFDKDSSKEYKHPTQKPVELVAKAITNSSKGEDIVLDLFLGSGSTLIASEKTGRICCGMELDPKYTDVIVQRYVDYTGNATIKKNGQEIIWMKTSDKKQ
jgi:DNA modification methylase